MEYTDTHYPVLIVGGGLAGLTLALVLGKHKVPTVLLDAQSPPKNDKTGDVRTTAFMPSSIQYLKNLNVWEDLQGHYAPLRTMRMIPIVPHNVMGDGLDFHASEIGADALAYNVDNHALRMALCGEIQACPYVTHHYNQCVNHMAHVDDIWHVSTDTQSYSADMIVGADGRTSFVRKHARIGCDVHDYHQTAIVCNVSHPHAHENISTEFMYASGAFTMVPLPSPNQSAVVWVEKSTQAQQILESDTCTITEKLNAKTHALWGTCTLVSDVQSFPLKTHMAHTNIAYSLALVGESYHGLTPVAAQGLNLSLRDSAVLGELVVQAYHNTSHNIANDASVPVWNVASVLDTYRKKRLADVKTRSMATQAFHTFCGSHNPISIGLKKWGVGILSRAGFVRKNLMELGLAFPGGTPKFMR